MAAQTAKTMKRWCADIISCSDGLRVFKPFPDLQTCGMLAAPRWTFFYVRSLAEKGQ